MKENSLDQTSVAISKEELAVVKTKAIRRGVWFKALTTSERAQINLTIKIVQKVRSHLLTKVLTSIIKKLLEAMESKVTQAMRVVGRGLAQKLSQIAQNWGNQSAVEWAADLGFVKFLAICHMNTSSMFKG